MSTNPVLEEIQREIKGFNGNVKDLEASMRGDLKTVRELAEEAKEAATNGEYKSQIEALTLSVTEKNAALEASIAEMKTQAERLETAFNRVDSQTGDDGAESMKHATAFFNTKAAVAGSLKWRNRVKESEVDIDGYKAWDEGFEGYLRADRDAIEAKALSVGSNPDGGYLVPTATSSRVIQKIYESSPLRQLATVETIGTEALELPIDQDEASFGWVGEEESRPETGTPRIGVQKITVYEMYAKPKATQKMLEDSAIDVEGWIANKIADRFARAEATAFVLGTGVNQPRGILTYDAGTTRGKIAQYISGHATKITDDAIRMMPYNLKGGYLSNASWLMNRSTVGAVMLLKDGSSQYMWRPGLSDGQPSTLVGHRVNMADDMPAVAAGTLPIAFGDFRAGYTVVDRLGITTLRDPFSAKPFVEFYSRKRVGGDVVDFEAIALMKIASS